MHGRLLATIISFLDVNKLENNNQIVWLIT